MKTKFLSILLCIAVLMSLLYINVSAAVYGDLAYEVHDGYIEITDCKENVTSVNIPAEINGLPVTEISNNAFNGCSALTNVTIPNSVTSIGYGAFSWCNALTNITIPRSVVSIGSSAFENCGYYNNKSNWQNGVLYIGNWLVSTNKEELPANYTIKSDTVGISSDAFRECKWLENVTIPNSVTSIGDGAFYDCSSLMEVTIPGSVSNIFDYTFLGCSSLTNVIISDGVTNIGDAFRGCSALTSVTIPASVTSISSGAFSSCDALTTVYYGGTEEQWKNIDIGYFNSTLESATIHYLGIDEGDPVSPVVEYAYTISDVSLKNMSGNVLTAPPSDSPFMVNVELTETKSRSAQDYLFVAIYNTQGALLSLDYVQADFIFNHPASFGFYVPAQTQKIGSVKAFVWRSFNSEEPLAESKEIRN